MKSVILIVVIFLSACSATGPVYHAEPEPSADESLLYVYRVGASDLAIRTAIIEVGNELQFELLGGGYAAVKLKPGHYDIQQSWKHWPGDYAEIGKPTFTSIELLKGETKYVELSIETQQSLMYKEVMWGLKQVSSEVAVKKINKYKQQKEIKKRSWAIYSLITRCSNTVPALRASTRQFVSSAFSALLRKVYRNAC